MKLPTNGGRPLGVAVADDVETCASTVASEIERVLGEGQIRSTDGSWERTIRPGDIAILFRARQSHREFDRALARLSIPTYVYKGLGFFDAEEIKDVRALIRSLANPVSELRAAALLRSRFARLSDPAFVTLAGHLSESLIADTIPEGVARVPADDIARLHLLRQGLHEWLDLVDRLPPAEVLDRLLLNAVYARELNGAHVVQARENLKKMRALIRKLQNRGYATMARVAEEVDHLSGDIATAIVQAFDAVHLMTVHAAKGLEFPVVFLVDLGRGTGVHTPAVRVITGRGDGHPSVTVWPYRSDARRGRASPRPRGDKASALRGLNPSARSAVSLDDPERRQGHIQPWKLWRGVARWVYPGVRGRCRAQDRCRPVAGTHGLRSRAARAVIGRRRAPSRRGPGRRWSG